MALLAVVDETRFEAGLDPRDDALVDVRFPLLAASGFDIDVDQLLAVDDRHAQFLCMRGVEQHAFHQHSLRLLRGASRCRNEQARIRENQAGRSAGRHAVAPGRHGVPRPAARVASRRPHAGAPERSGRTVVTSGTPALISGIAARCAALFPLVRFGGTRPSRIHAVGGKAPQPPCGGFTANSKRRSVPRKPVPQTHPAGAIALNSRPAVRSERWRQRLQFLACEVHGQRSGVRLASPRRATSAPAGAAGAPGFSGSPEKPRPLKYMQDGCGP